MERRKTGNMIEQVQEEDGYDDEEEGLYDLDEEEDNYEDENEENEEDLTSGSEDDDEEEEDQERSPPNGTTRHYENKTNKVLIKKGALSLTVGEARLYGLLDEKGEIKRRETPKSDPKKLLEINNKLSATKDFTELVTENEQKIAQECSFQPKKSQQALQAMKNPKCGYDFITRLNETGNFIERQFSSNKKTKEPKFVLEGMKDDYEARLDRLQCPKCYKYQSFDEFMDKRRICGPCQERYVKLHVSKFKSWEAKQAEHERKKREKLEKLDKMTTGQWTYKPTLTELNPEVLNKYQQDTLRRKEEKRKKEEEQRLKEEEEEKVMKEKIQRVQERFIQVKEARRKEKEEAMKATSSAEERDGNGSSSTKKRPTSAPANRRPPSASRPSVAAAPPPPVVTRHKTAAVATREQRQGLGAASSSRTGSTAPTAPPGGGVGKAKNEKTRKPVKYDKKTGNISDKFQLLLTADLE